MRLDWSLPARADIDDAESFIAQTSPEAGERMAARVREAVESLADQPDIGRPGRVAGTRELVVSGTPFIAIYRVRQNVITILRLLHHARRWP